MTSDCEAEVRLLRSQLTEKEAQVQQAAQAGLDLLSQQVELQHRLEEQRVELTNALEALEQDKYSLQKEVELKSRMLESLQLDHECVKKQHRQQLEEEQERLQRSHSLALQQLSSQNEKLQLTVEESQLNEKQLRHKLEVQSQTLTKKMEELHALSELAHTSMSSEMMEAQLKTAELESKTMELEQALQEAQHTEQQLQLSSGRLQTRLQLLIQEKEEREKEAVSCFNALEKSRQTNRELQVQLDLVLQQAQDPNSKGNSLFAELEDKRAEMERQLLSMKIQYQSLQKQHSFSRQQLQRMKVQMATLMQLQGSRADPAQLERLQAMLAEKNADIHALTSKLQRLERVEMMVKSQPSDVGSTNSSEAQDETYYTDLLQLKLTNSAKELERLGDELSLQRMKSLSESQRALELERKLFTSERLLKQTQSEKIKLQLRVEELQHKYEPKEAKKNVIQKRVKEKLPTDLPPSEESPREQSEPALSADPRAEAPPAEARSAADPPPLSSSQAPSLQPRPPKCVRISEDKPAVIPTSSSAVTGCIVSETEENEPQNKSDERRKPRVEVIHVKTSSSMENQCSQQ